MEDLPETYSLQTVEQMRAIADPLRIRIFEALTQRAMTATQVGEELQIAAPKAHYHVRELERIGLVRLVETKERSGILEKYYRAVARNLIAPPQLLQSAEPGEVAAAITEMFSNLSQSFLTALDRISAQGLESFDGTMMGLGGDTVWMTPTEFKETIKAVDNLFNPYRKRRGIDGEREAQVTIIGYDSQLAAHDTRDESASAPPNHATHASSPAPTQSQRPRIRAITVVGLTDFSRSDLEQVASAGQQLDLDVSGYLSFGADVTPELIDRAIARLRYRGILSAPSDVRAALKRKETLGN